MTPMMRQYYEIKKQHEDAILFFRLGDFYEMFGEDALIASKILGIVLTARSKGEDKIPMCGIPYHAAANYIAKLTRQGKKVAICEQITPKTSEKNSGNLNSPNAADQSKIVERNVIRIITPGTTLDEQVLDQKTSNYICSVVQNLNDFAFAFADITTGEFKVAQIGDFNALLNELEKIKPVELIASKEFLENIEGKFLKKKYPSIFYFEFETSGISEETAKMYFNEAESSYKFQNQLELNVSSLLIEYLKITQKNSLEHLKNIQNYDAEKYIALDEATIKNLELLKSAREHTVEGSLLGVLDKTVTNSGGRLLKKVIVQPLTRIADIQKRLEIVEYFLTNQNFLLDLRILLKGIGDIERMLARLSLNSGNARDLRGIFSSFKTVKAIKTLLLEANQEILNPYAWKLETLPEISELIEKAIVEEPPLSTKDGGMIREGFDQTLDEYKKISHEGKFFIQSLQEQEIKRTGINSLKVRYNRIFGYYIEISNANLKDVPTNYTRKQTLVNAERFVTPELKEYEGKVLGAEEKIIQIESELFEKVKLRVLEEIKKIQQTAYYISIIDVLSTFALISWKNKYCRPEIHEGFELTIEEGRHPVVEKINLVDNFVPNDLTLNEEEKLMLITGPNMGGKSTFLRQTALITLMAHLGIFVPATSAKIPVVDRIFTRVGASDNLVRGQSTFWVEMEETALILQKATERSLIILDEIGRGTSTFDGVSIAWGILEYLHDIIGAKTLFASHYHELIALADKLPKATNFSVVVQENEEKGVVFLYKVLRGGIDKSYGIEVAKLAGLPDQVIQRAKEILIDLEQEVLGGEKNKSEENIFIQQQRGIFSPEKQKENLKAEKICSILQSTDLNNLTPHEALNKLYQLKTEINQKD